jgi:Terminase small subunit
MGALADPRWERFCVERAGLKTVLDAYKAAGFAPNRGNAARFAARPEVVARVAELVEENRRVMGLRPETVLARLDRVATANLADFFETNDAGQLKLKDITKLPRDLTAALSSIKFDNKGRPEVKLQDASAANFVLLKYLGGLVEPNSTREVNIFNLLSIDDQRILAEALEGSVENEARGNEQRS